MSGSNKNGASTIATSSGILYQFEKDYRAGLQPDPIEYAKAYQHSPEYWNVLAELLHSDLELSLRAGNHRSITRYLEQVPELRQQLHLVLPIVEAELTLLHKLGKTPSIATYQQALPSCHAEVEKLFNLVASRAAGQQALNSPANASSYPDTPRDTEPFHRDPVLWAPGQLKEIGRYRLIHPLGQGGMGTVFEAEDPYLKRKVAIKIPSLKGPDKRRQELLQRFLQEGRAAATVHHPHLCPVYDAGEVNGLPYLTMALISGQPLHKFISPDKPWDESRAVELIRKLALAFQAAHDKGVIHRDIKPSNIIMNENMEPVVIDFGLASPPEGEAERITHFGDRFGTIHYMSPEHTSANPLSIGPVSDVYSLGVVLYELLTGKPPFSGDYSDVLVEIRSQPPVSPRRVCPKISEVVEKITLKAMAKKPDERFASMRAFADALSICTATKHPVELKHDDLQTPATTKKRPSANYLVALAMLAVIILGGLQIIKITTSNGTVTIEVKNPQFVKDIKIDGNLIQFTALGKQYDVKVGAHNLEITYLDGELESKEFTVTRGENKIVTLSYQPSETAKLTVKEKLTPEEIIKFIKDKGLVYEKNEQGYPWRIEENIENPQRPIPFSTADFKLIAKLDSLTEFFIHEKQLTPEMFRELCQSTSIVKLTLGGFHQLRDEDFKSLKNMTKLKEFGLSDCHNITDLHMKYVADVQSIERIGFVRMPITGTGFTYFKDNIKELGLDDCPNFKSSNLQHLRNCKSLEVLGIINIDIAPTDFDELQNITLLKALSLKLKRTGPESRIPFFQFISYNKELSALDLHQAFLYSKDVEQLVASGRNIRTLKIMVNAEDDKIISHLSALSLLTELNLEGSQFSKGALKNISKIKSLLALRLNGTSVDRTDIEFLSSMNLEWIELHGCKQITDNDLSLLKSLHKLRHVGLKDTNCSKEAKDTLRKALQARNPGAEVVD